MCISSSSPKNIQAREALRILFKQQYAHATGLIEGGDGTPVTLMAIYPSDRLYFQDLLDLGGQVDEVSLVVEWLPAGMTYTSPTDGSEPQEAGVDPKLIPDQSTWKTFPLKLNARDIRYRRGAPAWYALPDTQQYIKDHVD